jgi:hypothetical protein
MGPGHQLHATIHGDLDCLGAVGQDRTYDDLLDDSVAVPLADGIQVRALSLGALVQLKRQAGRPKDLAALPHLEATLAEIRRRGRAAALCHARIVVTGRAKLIAE